jgi:Secretion system C-terminal sorting domain
MKTTKLSAICILITGWCFAGCGPGDIKWKFKNTMMEWINTGSYGGVYYIQGGKNDTIQFFSTGNRGCSGNWVCDSLLKNNVKDSMAYQLDLSQKNMYKFSCLEGSYRFFFRNSNSSASMFRIAVNFIVNQVNYVGVSEVYSNTDFLTVYPNPTTKEISIRHTAQQILEIKLINTMGELVLNASPNNNQTIFNVEELPRGVYYLTAVLEDKKRVNKKIIIE